MFFSLSPSLPFFPSFFFSAKSNTAHIQFSKLEMKIKWKTKMKEKLSKIPSGQFSSQMTCHYLFFYLSMVLLCTMQVCVLKC